MKTRYYVQLQAQPLRRRTLQPRATLQAATDSRRLWEYTFPGCFALVFDCQALQPTEPGPS